jgi:hypothetical protein
VRAAREQKIDTLERAVKKVRAFLDTHEDKIGAEGQAKKSNITDNDSAKMKTSKGVIQGYNGVALVDDKRQVVVAAEAFGEGQEHALLQPVLEGARENFEALGQEAVLSQAKLAADAGFHSEDNLKYLAEREIDAYVADSQFRSRDERFEGAKAHKPAPEAKADEPASSGQAQFGPEDFQVDENFETCICPAGKRLYRTGTHCKINGYRAVKFHGAQRDCLSCPLRERCLKHPERTAARQVAFFLERMGKAPKKNVHCARMREKIDSEQGRYQLQPTTRDRGAGVCQHLQHPRAGLFPAARQGQGQHPVVAVLHGAQHRQAAAIWQLASRCRRWPPRTQRAAGWAMSRLGSATPVRCLSPTGASTRYCAASALCSSQMSPPPRASSRGWQSGGHGSAPRSGASRRRTLGQRP